MRCSQVIYFAFFLDMSIVIILLAYFNKIEKDDVNRYIFINEYKSSNISI